MSTKTFKMLLGGIIGTVLGGLFGLIVITLLLPEQTTPITYVIASFTGFVFGVIGFMSGFMLVEWWLDKRGF